MVTWRKVIPRYIVLLEYDSQMLSCFTAYNSNVFYVAGRPTWYIIQCLNFGYRQGQWKGRTGLIQTGGTLCVHFHVLVKDSEEYISYFMNI